MKSVQNFRTFTINTKNLPLTSTLISTRSPSSTSMSCNSLVNIGGSLKSSDPKNRTVYFFTGLDKQIFSTQNLKYFLTHHF